MRCDRQATSSIQNIMTTSDDNPFRAPQSSFEPVEDEVITNLRPLRICLGLQCTTIVLGVAAAFYDIESIVATGMVLSPIGMLVAFLSKRGKLTRGIAFGLSGPAISSFCLILITVLHWKPTDAQHLISLIAAAYTTFALPLGLYVWTRTGSDSVQAEPENRFDNALISDAVQHGSKKTGESPSASADVPGIDQATIQ